MSWHGMAMKKSRKPGLEVEKSRKPEHEVGIGEPAAAAVHFAAGILLVALEYCRLSRLGLNRERRYATEPQA